MDELRKLNFIPCEKIPPTLSVEISEIWELIPLQHRTLICENEVITGYKGYFRLFGTSDDENHDLWRWNQKECWKGYWQKELAQYLCFGATALGDQYCYLIDDLREGKETVYMLDAFTMEPDQLAENFSSFLIDDFLRNAIEPFDDEIRLLAKKYGKISANKMYQRIPHIFLEGSTFVEALAFPAKTNMIINADYFNTFSTLEDGVTVEKVETYSDKNGNVRVSFITSGVKTH